MKLTLEIGATPQRTGIANALAQFQSYKERVESDGGEIINETKTREMIQLLTANGLRGIPAAPWGGVRLVSGFVDKAYCMVPYSGSFLDWTQPTAASRPEQVGEEWSFDGVDDFLSVNIGDHPTQFTAFAKIATYATGTTDTIIGTVVESNSLGSRWQMIKGVAEVVAIQTFTGTESAAFTNTPHNGNNYIATVDDDTVELFKDGVSTGTTTGSSINPAGDTEVRIGLRNNGSRPFPENIEGVVGLITSIYNSQQITGFNSIM